METSWDNAKAAFNMAFATKWWAERFNTAAQGEQGDAVSCPDWDSYQQHKDNELLYGVRLVSSDDTRVPVPPAALAAHSAWFARLLHNRYARGCTLHAGYQACACLAGRLLQHMPACIEV
jgi:hypothetical protein